MVDINGKMEKPGGPYTGLKRVYLEGPGFCKELVRTIIMQLGEETAMECHHTLVVGRSSQQLATTWHLTNS